MSGMLLREETVSRTPALSCLDVYGPRPIAIDFSELRFRVTTADVYPASLRGLNDHRREPRWIFARFHLNDAKALAEAMPVQTPGSGSDGGDPLRVVLAGPPGLPEHGHKRPVKALSFRFVKCNRHFVHPSAGPSNATICRTCRNLTIFNAHRAANSATFARHTRPGPRSRSFSKATAGEAHKRGWQLSYRQDRNKVQYEALVLSRGFLGLAGGMALP